MTTDASTTVDAIELPAAPTGALARTLAFDDHDGLADVIDALFLEPFVSGSEPWGRFVYLPRVRPDAALVPDGGVVIRTAVDQHSTVSLVRGGGWTMRIIRNREGWASVAVSAVDEATGRALIEATTSGVEPDPEPEESVAVLGFWHLGQRGAIRRERTIAATPWPELRRNYTSTAAVALDDLMALGADQLSGRLLLLHGPPGTGKTTALRTLSHAWRSWCQLDVVLDPERLFANPGYLMTVAMGDDDRDDGRWRLLLLEDCDELIRSEAKAGAGQALSRLLNITDGLLGQGLDLIVALTTNEPLGRLHPAVTRPGRCLAEVEVGALTPAEAAAWLGRPTATRSHLTLAELYARQRGAAIEPPVAVGQYL